MIPVTPFAFRTRRSLVVAVTSVALAVPMLASLGSTALADQGPPVAGAEVAADVAGAPRHQGTRVNVAGDVGRYIVGPLGHVRGFILKDRTVVMVRGNSGDDMARQVPIGQPVRVEGWSPAASGGKEIRRAAVYGQHGQIVAPPVKGEGRRDPSARGERRGEMRAELAKLPPVSANGTVETVVIGRRGMPEALVLTDGTSVFLRPRLAKEVMTRGVRAGDRIEASGKGGIYPLGSSVVVRSITFGDGAHFEVQGGARAPR